ncbi:V-type proton ATPase subunit S1-like [Acropora millepora]|uniref:V-type proton ATPase subunit S1-like n=1 Tax=Acropora millepora TaxID=45264 RepID=UPI001CF202BE|nr:V-type proton ATPase subunit S1-like [Acropora millepora]
MAALSTSLFLLSFILFFAFAKSGSQVPVFIWSKDSELNGATPVLAGHTVEGNDFEEKYLDRLFESPKLICVFIQDRLSVDDISRYGDAYSPGDSGAAFSNLKIAMETANSSVVLPLVELNSAGVSHELVNLIKRKTDGLVREFSPEEHHAFNIKEFLLHRKKTNVCIFHLLPSSTSLPEEIFVQNDKLIGAIVEQISASGLPYSCILTSTAPNVDVETRYVAERRANMAHDRLRRDVTQNAFDDRNILSSSTVNGSVFVDAQCILLYTEGVVFTYNEKKYNIFNMTGLAYSFSGECRDKAFEDSVVVSFKMGNVKTFDLRMSFSLTSNDSSYEWRCANASLDVEGTFEGEHIKDIFRYNNCGKSLTAPVKYSYSCFDVTLNNDNSSISFKQFQVQPFNVPGNGTFSYAYDCIGFFTIPIFMGLITAGVLLVILFCGILSMLSLTTMDRFDDPKGQTIQVATS